MVSHRETAEGLTYNFTYRERSLLAQVKPSIKVDLTRTSLLLVIVRELQEIFNLQALLDGALPKMAGLNLLILAYGIEEKKLK